MFKLSRRRFLQVTAASAALATLHQPFLRILADDGPRQWSVTGTEIASLAAFDKAVQSFMQDRNIPGGALAVTRNGHLMLARGYAWTADSSEKVDPTSLLRIASVTKPFTSVAIMTLVQANKLKLSQKVVDILDMTPPPGKQADPGLKDITILHLLQHLGGWDRDKAFDPMFYDKPISKVLKVPLPISTHDIIKYMNGEALQSAPGTKYAYSNYGYCLLGRVIETLGKQPYDTYVIEKVLKPVGVTSMMLGKSLLSKRARGEVKYYTQDDRLYSSVVDKEPKVPVAYGTFNLENMDSHGRWIASAIDLMRFAVSFDKATASPILSAESINTLFAPPAIGTNTDGTYYACGWVIVPVNKQLTTWHDGSLPGTSTWMVRRFDGIHWAMLFDQRDDPSGKDYGAIDSALHKAADSIKTWPDHDLFEQYK